MEACLPIVDAGDAMAEMVQASHRLTVQTPGEGFTEITRELADWLNVDSTARTAS